MNQATTTRAAESAPAGAPVELLMLKERIAGQSAGVRRELEPLIDEAMEHAQFRAQVMWVAREALQRYRLDLARTRFDLEATRRERDLLRV